MNSLSWHFSHQVSIKSPYKFVILKRRCKIRRIRRWLRGAGCGPLHSIITRHSRTHIDLHSIPSISRVSWKSGTNRVWMASFRVERSGSARYKGNPRTPGLTRALTSPAQPALLPLFLHNCMQLCLAPVWHPHSPGLQVHFFPTFVGNKWENTFDLVIDMKKSCFCCLPNYHIV